MEFYDVVKSRKSCRDYLAKPVCEEQLYRVLEAARLAPSWKNLQCSRYIVVSDRSLIQQIGQLLSNNPNVTAYTNATYIIVLCANPADSGIIDGKEYYMVDCAISMEHLCLAATNEGLGTCWVGLFHDEPIRQLLEIPDPLRVVALTPLGYPSGVFRERPRKAMSEIVFREKWGKQ